MRKIICMILLIGLFSFAGARPAEAWLIAKFSNMAEDATTAISKFGKDVQNAMDKVANSTVAKTIGKGFTEARDWTEKNVSKLKDFAEEAKENANAIKGAVDEVKNSDLAKYKQLTDDVKDIADQMKTITAEMEGMQSELKGTYDAQIAQIDGKRTTTLDNMSMLKKLMQEHPTQLDVYQKQYDAMQADIAGYDKDIKNLNERFSSELQNILEPKQKELKNLKKDLTKLKRDLEIIAGMTGDEPTAAEALSNTANLYFQQYDEDEDTKRQDEIRRNRLLERRRSIFDAYTQSIAFIPELVTRDHEGEDQGYAASTFDTTGGAWGADAELKVKNLIALRDYARLLVYDLKMQTANQVSILTFYKLKKPLTNISEFNLDDYVYKMPKGSK